MRILVGLICVVVFAVGVLWLLGGGLLGEQWHAGSPQASRMPAPLIQERADGQAMAARDVGVPRPKQVVFGDLHVHSSFSTDAFMMSLPLSGGDGARPVADACDFARVCSALDFWSINDHALAITQRRWDETVESIRACNDVSGDPENPDVAAFLGWEWTQVGTTPKNHYGHKNVILRYTDDERIPSRPIAATLGRASGEQEGPSRLLLGLLPLTTGGDGIALVKYFNEMLSAPDCPPGPVRDAPAGCIERAVTPGELFAKLDEWGHESMVIPHGTTWGYYTPMGSAWDKQLTPDEHDPSRQTLIEVYSGHGNSEEYRSFREVIFESEGGASCPEPSPDYLPSCWRAGEIIRERCLDAGEPEEECESRAADARRHYIEGDVAGHHAIPGESAVEWGDAGQCRDCFQPTFNLRPRSSVQYIMA
ncbi:MAG: hypothetical protein JRE70_19460, partial [Deltaproteobacteria bacterium]|nr:hypothetical protein [Deltaproteobacteria bacterium]